MNSIEDYFTYSSILKIILRKHILDEFNIS